MLPKLLLNRELTTLVSPSSFPLQVLIFSQMTQLLNILDYYLEERFGAAFRLDGSVKLEERRRQVGNAVGV